MIRKIMSLLVVLGVFTFGLIASGDAEKGGDIPRFIEIGTAGTGGAYYPVGIAMAEVLTDTLKTQATAQVTGGAVDNIRLIQEGSVKLAITSAASAYRGLKGVQSKKFEQKIQHFEHKIQLIMQLYFVSRRVYLCLNVS